MKNFSNAVRNMVIYMINQIIKGENMKDEKRKIFEKIFVAVLLLAITTIEPVFAWGGITHEAIVEDLNMPYESYVKGGTIGTDMFYFLPGKESYSTIVHTTRTADFPRELLRLAGSNNAKKAYSSGSLSHAASDVIGHTQYVNPIAGSDITLHTLIEIGVDAHVANRLDSLSFSIPYELVRNGYRNIYGISPSYWDIYAASRNMMTAMYIEKYLIDTGMLDDLKEQVVGWEVPYSASVDYSRAVISNPSILQNRNLYTGELLATSNSMINTNTRANIDAKIRNSANELVKNNIVKESIKDDKQNKVLHVEDIEIKDKKKFEEEMKKLNTR